MRSVTLYNDGQNGDGGRHDKVYVLTIEQVFHGNPNSFKVTAIWSGRDTNRDGYHPTAGAQSVVKVDSCTLAYALRYVAEKADDKVARGYRIVDRFDTNSSPLPSPVAVAPAAVAPVSEEQRWRLAAMIPPPAFPTVRNGREISAEYPTSVAFPVTTAYLAAVQAAIRTGDLQAVHAVRDGGALTVFIEWHRAVIAVWEGRPAPAPAAPAAPVQSRRSLGAQRAAATRRRRREAGVYANRPPRQSPRPTTLSDDCGGNPVVAGAISAADYWKR